MRLKKTPPELAGILAGGLLIRLSLWIFKFGRDDYFHGGRDDGDYLLASQELWSGEFISSPKIMPGFPAWEGLWGGIPNVIYVNMLLDLISIYALYRISIIIFKHEREALLAAGLFAIAPSYLYFSNHAYTENLYACLLLLSWWALLLKKYHLASVGLVLGILIRPVLLPFAPLLILIFARFTHQYSWIQSVKKVAIYGFYAILLLSPWWWHNHQKFDQFVPLNLGAGEVMYHGQVNLARSNKSLTDAEVFDLTPFDHLTDPFERDATMKKAVWDFRKASPEYIPVAIFKNTIKFWLGTPEVFYGAINVIVGFFQQIMVFLFIVFLMFYAKSMKDSRLMIPLYSLIAYFTVVHALLHGMTRYKMPLEPFLLMCGAMTVIGFIHHHRNPI